MTLTYPTHYTPRAVFSPSQLTLAARCWRSWCLRYLHGVKGASGTPAQMFGSLIHASLEGYAHGRHFGDIVIDGVDAKAFAKATPEERAAMLRAVPKMSKLRELAAFTPEEQLRLVNDAPIRAMSATHLLPVFAECEWVKPEVQLSLDTSAVCPSIEPVVWSDMSAMDLLFGRNGQVYLYDYKSTKGGYTEPTADRRREFDPWLWVPSEDALKTDCQFVIEALSVMQRCGVGELWCRWVYVNTHPDKTPQSKPLDVHVTWGEMAANAVQWIELADKCRQWVNACKKIGPPKLDDLPLPLQVHPDPKSPCKSYGGCPYHVSRDGPCRTLDVNALAAQLLTVTIPQTKEAEVNEELKARLAALSPEALSKMPPEGQALAAPSPTPPAAPIVSPPAAPAPQPPDATFPVWLGTPTAPPTGVDWIDAHGRPLINGLGQRLDTAGHPMAYAPAATPAFDLAPGEFHTTPTPAPRSKAKPRRSKKTGETEEQYQVRLAAWLAQAEPEAKPAPAATPAPSGEVAGEPAVWGAGTTVNDPEALYRVALSNFRNAAEVAGKRVVVFEVPE